MFTPFEFDPRESHLDGVAEPLLPFGQPFVCRGQSLLAGMIRPIHRDLKCRQPGRWRLGGIAEPLMREILDWFDRYLGPVSPGA